MSIKRNLVTPALMAVAFSVVALPLTVASNDAAHAAGISKEKDEKRSSFSNKKSFKRTVTRRAKKAVSKYRAKIVRKKSHKLTTKVRKTKNLRPAKAPSRPVIAKKNQTKVVRRPAVTTPKSVLGAKIRPTKVISPPPRPAVTTPKTVAGAQGQVDPTTGRLQQRQRAQNQKEYQKCATFSNSVLQGCYSQAQGDPAKQTQCRSHYQGNIVRCQGLL